MSSSIGDYEKIEKIGEGTYGRVFVKGGTFCWISNLSNGFATLKFAADFSTTDGEWYTLEIPLQDLVDSGLDVTQVTAPLVLIGQSGETGDILLVDAVYLNQQ